MADVDKKRVVGSRPTGMNPTGMVPTGAEQDSSGSSVEIDSDLATVEEIPLTEEILRMAEERRKAESKKGE